MKRRETEVTEEAEETSGAGVLPDRSHSGSNICLLVAGKVQHDL